MTPQEQEILDIIIEGKLFWYEETSAYHKMYHQTAIEMCQQGILEKTTEKLRGGLISYTFQINENAPAEYMEYMVFEHLKR